MDRWSNYPFQNSVAQKYNDDAHFRVLVDTFTAMLWDGKYTVSELRSAAIFAAMQVESIRIRPMLFDPNNYSIEYGVLKQVRDEVNNEAS
jgi:hypothetical protein